MSPVDPCSLGKQHTCNVTSGSIWFMKRTHMQCHKWIHVVYEKNTHEMTLVDQCDLVKERTCNESSGLMWFRKRTHMQ